MIEEVEAHESRNHCTLMKKVKSTISTNINMGISRLFYQFSLSRARYYQMGYSLNTNTDSVHMEGKTKWGQLLGNLFTSSKLDKCDIAMIYSKYTWISKQINWICTWIYLIWNLCRCFIGAPFRNGIWRKHRIMGLKVKQITLWTQARKWKLVFIFQEWSRK